VAASALVRWGGEIPPRKNGRITTRMVVGKLDGANRGQSPTIRSSKSWGRWLRCRPASIRDRSKVDSVYFASLSDPTAERERHGRATRQHRVAVRQRLVAASH